ncbi:MAG: bifunctional riboflavin kinase/FAD synthetase [Micromonosporaceae bacterium]|nr:bifunctional riboflavin kinase/FAD synthetase [Micromonosporaceae bacterium]
MRRWMGYDAVPADWSRSVVTIGVFDGVHRGHQHTIGQAVKRSVDLGVRSVVVTFDPHPAGVLRPGSQPAVLTELDAKAELIGSLGVDALCVIPFTSDVAQLPARVFVQDVLVGRLHSSLIVIGASFRFGRRAEGDVDLLRSLGVRLGYAVEEAELLRDDVAVFSSTHIRACIASGEVERASRALGRPHRLDGVVVRGDHRGRSLGFPTANLRTADHVAMPADGVYAGWLVRGGQRLPSAMSIGTNPTFDDADRRVEAHVLDFDQDLYGERVSVEFVARLRDMRAFSDQGELIAQIRFDVERTRQLLSL